MAGRTRSRRAGAARNQFRIIGGKWRARRFGFPEVADIRPTPDRVRETLFNWLQSTIRGAHCLDLFAGSGALGLEALSRGAASAVFVEQDRRAVESIREHVVHLSADARVCHADAFDFLRVNTDTFDVVFLDPPFARALMKPAMVALSETNSLEQRALVYVEAASGKLSDGLPGGWMLTRTSKAGQVEYGLAERDPDSDKTNQAE